jgi:flagellar protein FliL
MAKDKAADGTGDDAAKAAAAKKKKMMIIALVALVAIGGVYKFVLAKPKAASAAKPAPVPGAVLALDPVNINLADGHYLKLGMTLQATKDAGAEVADGSKALDTAIGLLSGQSVAVVANDKDVVKLKKELVTAVGKRYDEKVMDIYFTSFVYQ